MERSRGADSVGMARFIVALLFFLIGIAAAQAQTGYDYLVSSPERLIGLLDLPGIVRNALAWEEKLMRRNTP